VNADVAGTSGGALATAPSPSAVRTEAPETATSTSTGEGRTAGKQPVAPDDDVEGPITTPRMSPAPVAPVSQQPRLFDDDDGLAGLVGTGIHKGSRHHQEDRIVVEKQVLPGVRLCAVLDGHSGSKAVEYVATNLSGAVRAITWAFDSPSQLEEQFSELLQALDRDLCKHLQTADTAPSLQGFEEELTSGCVGCICLQERDWIHIAKIGDCRCWARKLDDGIVDITGPPHHPEEEAEKERLRAAGVDVAVHDTRLYGLSVSRALGDFRAANLEKPKGLITTPAVITRSLEDLQLILIGSDGVDLSDDLSLTHARRLLREGKDATGVAEFLAKKCGEAQDSDNTAVIAVVFKKPEPLAKSSNGSSAMKLLRAKWAAAEALKKKMEEEDARVGQETSAEASTSLEA